MALTIFFSGLSSHLEIFSIKKKPFCFHCASRVSKYHPIARAYVRLLGPCFKTGRSRSSFRPASLTAQEQKTTAHPRCMTRKKAPVPGPFLKRSLHTSGRRGSAPQGIPSQGPLEARVPRGYLGPPDGSRMEGYNDETTPQRMPSHLPFAKGKRERGNRSPLSQKIPFNPSIPPPPKRADAGVPKK